jgi:hypothetical protein
MVAMEYVIKFVKKGCVINYKDKQKNNHPTVQSEVIIFCYKE